MSEQKAREAVGDFPDYVSESLKDLHIKHEVGAVDVAAEIARWPTDHHPDDARALYSALNLLPPAPVTPAPAPEKRLYTELGNAYRIRDQWHHELRYTTSWGWLAWDGMRWKRDQDMGASARAIQTIEALWDEAKYANGTDEAKEAAKWAITSQKSKSVSACTNLASTLLVDNISRYDQDDNLLNLRNGTLNLTTLKLSPHSQDDRITTVANASYDPDADAPMWNAFLDRVQPDGEVRSFLQRAAGYSLLGDPTEEKALMHIGGGANGKTKYHNAIRYALGDYASSISFDALLNQKVGAATNDIAALVGCRFVLAGEPPANGVLNEAKFKAMTGGEVLRVRFHFKEFFDLKPQFMLSMYGNHSVRIKGADAGIWRRMVMVPWNVQIPAGERDKHLEKKLATEADGIFRWLVDGLIAYREHGFGAPSEISKATRSYQSNEDTMGELLDECFEIGHAYSITNKELRSVLKYWADLTDERAMGIRLVGSMLAERGYERFCANGKRGHHGLRMKSEVAYRIRG